MTEEADFGVDSSKTGGRRSYCKACDRRRGRAYYDAHKDELDAAREAAREAAWQAELEALAAESKKRAAEQKKLHAAQVRHQKEFLRSLGVPDLSRRRSPKEPASGLEDAWEPFWRHVRDAILTCRRTGERRTDDGGRSNRPTPELTVG